MLYHQFLQGLVFELQAQIGKPAVALVASLGIAISPNLRLERFVRKVRDVGIVALGQPRQRLAARIAEIPAQRVEIEFVDRHPAALKPRDLIARGDRAEIEQWQRENEGQHAGRHSKMHVGAAHALHPPRHAPSDRRDEIGEAIGHCHGHRDDTPQPFGAESVFGDPRAGRDRREQRQREDCQRQHQCRPPQCAIAGHLVIGVADHRIDQHETRHSYREQQRCGAFGRIPQHRYATCQHRQQEDCQRHRERHRDDREHQHHHRLQRADDLQLVAQHTQRRAEGRARKAPAEPALVDEVLDQIDVDGGEQRGEQQQQQPRDAGKDQRARAADGIGPDMEMRAVVGRPPAQAMETGLEQRQRQRDRDQSRRHPESLVGMALARRACAPGDPGHDERHHTGKDQRLFPARAIEREGKGQRSEHQRRSQRCAPGDQVGACRVGNEMNREPGQREQRG